MGWTYTQLVLVSIAAMLSPTTLTFSVLVVVLAAKPLRAASWFYLGALTVTLAIGVLAAFVLGNHAADASSPATPKTWVAILDVAFAVLILAWTVRLLRRPKNPERTASAVAQMSRVASSPVVALVGAGAMLANPGAFIPIALKTISELNPGAAQYIAYWAFFTLMALLPLLAAIIALIVRRQWAERVLGGARVWLESNARTIAAVIVVLLALSLLRDGIAGLTS
jgi:hypothetical protein